MTHNAKVLWVNSLLLIALSASLSVWPLSGHSFMPLVGLISFVLSSFLISPSNKTQLLVPVLFAFCVSLFPLVSDFNPNNISGGWGGLFFIGSWIYSVIGTVLGFRLGQFLRAKRNKSPK